MPVYHLSSELVFPSPHLAIDEGLLAVGGDLSLERLLLAYHQGIFPWYSRGEPILWWSPNPRLVLYPTELNVSRRLERTIRQKRFQITLDSAFGEVIRACAAILRHGQKETWITAEMIAAYIDLHQAGFAHSVEAWQKGRLVGGLYGVSLGGSFFGESMFHLTSDASNVALVALARYLVHWNFDLIDCQVPTDHLFRMGATKIPRSRFLDQLTQSLEKPTRRGRWKFNSDKGVWGKTNRNSRRGVENHR